MRRCCMAVGTNGTVAVRVAKRARVACLIIPFALAAPAHALDPRKSNTQFTHTAWSAKDGIPGPVRAIAQTGDGYLWLGTDAGLYRFDGRRFVLCDQLLGLPLASSRVSSLFVSRDDSLWIGFNSAQISRLHGGVAKSYSANEGVPRGAILSIVEDR